LEDRELYSNKNPKLSNKEIVDGIRSDNSEALKFVYEEYFQYVYLNIVKGDLLNEDDARDIFHDAMIVLYNNIRKETFILEHSFTSYLFNVCQKLTLKRLRLEYRTLNNKNVSLDQIIEEDEKNFQQYPELIYDPTQEIKYELFTKYFAVLKEDCKKVLTMFYSDEPYEEIAREMGYAEGEYVKVKKHRCKEYLVNSIMKDKLFNLLRYE
jgi:RNA polymerase sigma factor (sigma-70 family)